MSAIYTDIFTGSEVILYRDKATNEIISGELRLLDNQAYINRKNAPDYPNDRYAKFCNFSSLDELKQ